MRRDLPILPILVLLTLPACSQTSVSVTFELPKAELQQKLEQKFPLEPGREDSDAARLGLKLHDPVVLLEEGKDQVGVRVGLVAEPAVPPRPRLPPRPGGPRDRADGDAPRPRFTGSVTVYTGVRYDPAAKAIRLADPKVERLEIEQLPDALNEPLSRLAERALAKRFAEQPIPLEGKTKLDAAVNTFLKSVTVRDGKLLVEVGW